MNENFDPRKVSEVSDKDIENVIRPRDFKNFSGQDKILENLWNSNDWEHLLEKTRKLAEADPFFGTLLDIIDDPDYPLDEVTITQLLTTI